MHDPQSTPVDLDRRRRRYTLGATSAPHLPTYFGSRVNGNEERHAYAAGVIASTFGVDLTQC